MNKLILTTASIALLLTVGAACLLARPRYQQYRRARALREAKAFLLAGDFPNASLSARQVLQAAPGNLDACCIMAELAEACHSPAELDWRQRITEISPTMGNRLKLASSALRFQRPPYALAAQTLDDLEPLGSEFPAFHVLSAELALKRNEAKEAIMHFEQAVHLEPANELNRFNLAVLNLQSTNQETLQAAGLTLERLSTNRAFSVLALRWRVAENLQRKKFEDARRLSEQLLSDPRAVLQDHLQHLSVLQLCRSSAFPDYLQTIQARAATNAVDLYSTSEWLGAHGLADEAISWLARLDAQIREAPPVALAVANLFAAKRDWVGLEAHLRGRKWEELEFLRLALLSQAASGQQQNVAADARWRSALDAAAGHLAPLALLLGLATDWGRNPDDVLWEIGRRFPREQWALRELEKRYWIAGNTRGMNRIYSARESLPSSSSDTTNRNNFATSSLLLKINLSQAHAAARDLYRQSPQDPVIASTYAYSLHLQGRSEAGLAVFAGFNPHALETPSIALYYGVLLASARQSNQATRYLRLAETVPLLPEEKQLLAEARASLR